MKYFQFFSTNTINMSTNFTDYAISYGRVYGLDFTHQIKYLALKL